MARSTKASWLEGQGDLREADVEDVPVAGESVRVRALAAKYSAEVQGQLKMVQEGSEEVARFDIASMEALQFANGCIDPVFSLAEARVIQAKFGPAFRKVIAKIDELSGIDKDTLKETETRFPAGGEAPARGDGLDGSSDGGGGPDVRVRAGAGVGHDAE